MAVEGRLILTCLAKLKPVLAGMVGLAGPEAILEGSTMLQSQYLTRFSYTVAASASLALIVTIIASPVLR